MGVRVRRCRPACSWSARSSSTLSEGQPLFAQVDEFLRAEGFVLWRFDNRTHYTDGDVLPRLDVGVTVMNEYTSTMARIGGGQLFEADAYWVRAELCRPSVELDAGLARRAAGLRTRQGCPTSPRASSRSPHPAARRGEGARTSPPTHATGEASGCQASSAIRLVDLLRRDRRPAGRSLPTLQQRAGMALRRATSRARRHRTPRAEQRRAVSRSAAVAAERAASCACWAGWCARDRRVVLLCGHGPESRHRRGRGGHRFPARPHPRTRGLRRAVARLRPEGARRPPGDQGRRRHPRPRPARHGRSRGLPQDARPGLRRRHHDRHRARRRARPRGRPRLRRRRLHVQAVRPRRAAGAGARAAPSYVGLLRVLRGRSSRRAACGSTSPRAGSSPAPTRCR